MDVIPQGAAGHHDPSRGRTERWTPFKIMLLRLTSFRSLSLRKLKITTASARQWHCESLHTSNLCASSMARKQQKTIRFTVGLTVWPTALMEAAAFSHRTESEPRDPSQQPPGVQQLQMRVLQASIALRNRAKGLQRHSWQEPSNHDLLDSPCPQGLAHTWQLVLVGP